jgi:type II secretory pathway predicted ATPase ExeA
MNLLSPMLEFYGLREQPFAGTSDPAYFYAAPPYRECLFRIWTGLEGGFGPVIVLGNPGMGKTVVLRKLLSHLALSPDRYNVAVIASPSPTWTALSLLEAILDRFGIDADGRSFSSQLEALNRYLLADPERINLLVIDDSQNLIRRGQVELLRLTQNIETPQRKLLNLVIFGQSSWVGALHETPNFTQRAHAIVTLNPLSREDSLRMVEFRLRQAGAQDPYAIFTQTALHRLHDNARGVPRTLVTLCRNALIVGSMAKARPIGPEVVQYATDKTQLPENVSPGTPPAFHLSADDLEPEPEGGPEPAEPRRSARPYEEQANQLLLRASRNRPV